MNYGTIKNLDIANGPGIRVSLFVSGCRNHCKGCFQPETWDFKYGKELDGDAFYSLIEMLRSEHIAGLSILGGDPFEIYNQGAVYSLMKRVVTELPRKNIWIYTGYLYEDLINPDWNNRTIWTDSILYYADVIVDGPFILAQKDLRLRLKGSTNQRIIDMNKTRESGDLTEWKG